MADTFAALQEAVQAHIHANTNGDLVTGFVLVAGIVDAESGEKTSWMTTSHTARWEARGLLHEGVVFIDQPQTGE